IENPTKAAYMRGGIYGLAAVCIWGAFIVVSRLGVRTSLTPWDVAAIRFTVAGILLAPYLGKRGLALDRLGWTGVTAIIAGCGAPMVLLVNVGLLFAPAAHGGALFPGVMPLMVAILASMVLKEPFSVRKRIGFVIIVLGAVGIVWGRGGTIGTTQNIGHALFLLSTLCFSLRVSHGLATLCKCGAPDLMAAMRPLLRRSDRWCFTYPSIPISQGPAFSKSLCLILDCRRSFRASLRQSSPCCFMAAW